MTVYNLGSINIDHVYTLQEFPRPGQTISAEALTTNLGGKGLNISVALSRAGADVRHIGAVGNGDALIQSLLAPFDLDLERVALVEAPTGHAIIYLDQTRENQIVIFPGANGAITEAHVSASLASAGPGDWLVLQNETNANDIGLSVARAKGMKVALVAAPFDATMPALMEQVDLVSVNEEELRDFEAATGSDFRTRTDMSFLVTYGAKGAEFVSGGESHKVAAHKVEVADTTGAGDTFFGGFMAQYANGATVSDALEFASAMAALQVQSLGAAVAIPSRDAVLDFLNG
jgi:ribokinase